MDWVIPSVIIVSVALLLEGLMTGLGSGFLAGLGFFLSMTRNARIMDKK